MYSLSVVRGDVGGPHGRPEDSEMEYIGIGGRGDVPLARVRGRVKEGRRGEGYSPGEGLKKGEGGRPLKGFVIELNPAT